MPTHDIEDFSDGLKYKLQQFFAEQRLSAKHLQSLEDTVTPLMLAHSKAVEDKFDDKLREFGASMGKRVGAVERSQQTIKGGLGIISLLITIGLVWYANTGKDDDYKTILKEIRSEKAAKK